MLPGYLILKRWQLMHLPKIGLSTIYIFSPHLVSFHKCCRTRPSTGDHGGTSMANPVLVPQAHKTIDSRASAPPTRTQASHTTTLTRKDTSVERQTHPDGLSLIRASLTGRCISEQAREILL